jgi:hypothetical protein
MARRVDAPAVILRRETSHFSRTYKYALADPFDIIMRIEKDRVDASTGGGDSAGEGNRREDPRRLVRD